MTSNGRRKINVRLLLPLDSLGDDWIIRSISTMPPPLRPTLFGGGERLDRRRSKPVADHEALREQTRKHSSASLHGENCYVHAWPWDKKSGEISAYLRSNVNADSIRLWFTNMDALGATYGMAAQNSEYEHRHFASIQCIGGFCSQLMATIGKDHDKYVPGLYWMNYLSAGYSRNHGVDVDTLAEKTNGSLEGLPNGHLLQIYPKSVDWNDNSDRIDSILERDLRFFSMRRANIPATIVSQKLDELSHSMHVNWP